MKTNKRRILAVLLVLAMVFSFAACGGADEPATKEGPAEIQGTIILATTTSTKDSGLLDFILPEFTYNTGWEVDVISVGSGEAMAMGENGDADVLLVHSPKDEVAFVENGHADADGRFDVMYNDFVLVGPSTDPSGILTAANADAVAAFTKIFNDQSTFISRGDQSGTHKKELSIWAKAALTPAGDWYVEAASGMGAVITMADEKLAYTLADRATWLNVGEDTDLQIVCEKDPSGIFNNQYGVICVNSEKNELINAVGAKEFQNWIISAETQKLIGTYGIEEFGAPLFTPNAK
ncbi:MAG: substrate-binding domain-containing protein [Peptostreptococcaceae bacterium]|nr:substrate-binding domain-containing protein [Peptostreptococcaceae bacterium]